MARITRRHACRAVAGGGVVAFARHMAAAQAADWSFISFPDPQYLSTETAGGAGGSGAICSPYTATPEMRMYNRMMQWVIDHQAQWNIKFAISMGDCSDGVSSASLNDQETITTAAWQKLRDAGIPDQPCLGNHDCGFSESGAQRRPSWAFQQGIFSPGQTSAFYKNGIALYNGGHGFWGGHYQDPQFASSGGNCYTRFALPDGRRVLVIAVEFFPRSAVLNWAKEVHDAHPDHEVWLTTHAYKRLNNTLFRWNDPFAPGDYKYVAPPAYNSGEMMWHGPAAGSDASLTGYLATWRNLTLILCGHDTANSPGWWYWTHLEQASLSDRKQKVHAVTCNCQGIDYNNKCGAQATPAGQVMIHKVRPSLGVMEMYVVSTNTGQWLGDCANRPCSTAGMWRPAPYRLGSIPFGGLPGRSKLFPLPSSIGQ